MLISKVSLGGFRESAKIKSPPCTLYYWFPVSDWIYIKITTFPQRYFVDGLLDAVMESLVCWPSNETFQTKSFQTSGSQSGAQRPPGVLDGVLMQQKKGNNLFSL